MHQFQQPRTANSALSFWSGDGANELLQYTNWASCQQAWTMVITPRSPSKHQRVAVLEPQLLAQELVDLYA